jgi:PPOX class probable F420-dependent enzyme
VADEATRWARSALEAARIARLGTVRADGTVGLVPICFTVVDGWIGGAVDHKPKRHGRLQRLVDIEAAGRATVLVDHYDEDWSELWWVRVRGRATVHARDETEAAAVVAALRRKYTQYRDRPPTGAVFRIAIDDVRAWRAGG